MIHHPMRRDLELPADARRRHFPPGASRCAVRAILLVATAACGSKSEEAPRPSSLVGEELFKKPFPGSNGRSCATCHVPEDNFTLTPAHVARVLETKPEDPLFNAIDADDPTAATLTFEHLKKGLVRVWLTLPNNVDLIDEHGNVTTPPDRKIFVWRGVPSILNTATSAPFQLDGREATLEEQAQGAFKGHSQAGEVSKSELEYIAAFERSVFSSDRARIVADELARGVDLGEVSDVEGLLEMSPQETRGREVYEAICAACHGGANKATIVDRQIHDRAFPAIRRDGTVLFQVPATDPPTPVFAAQPQNTFLNIGTAYEAFIGHFDPDSHSYTKDLSFPNYRYRFYTDGSRTKIAGDLPPSAPPLDFSGGGGFGGGDGPGGGDAPGGGDGPGGGDAPGGPIPNDLDSDGNPITGPNFAIQTFSTDPGRSMITGSPNDFEAFDVPTLRGIAETAPYFHNNVAADLETVVDLYSDHFLSRFPSLTLPGEKEPDDDGDLGPPEALTRDQKNDLIAFLRRL